MEDLWRLVVVLAAATVIGVWLLVARALRKRRLAGLEPIAKEMGLFFHGGTFRGQFEGHAVRGDGEGEIPRLEAPERASLFRLFTRGRKAVRVRVELTSPPGAFGSGQSASREKVSGTFCRDGPSGAAHKKFLTPFPAGASPDVTKAAVAARKDLRDRGTDAGLFEVALQGTELIFVLRGEAATPEAARRVVEKAIKAARAG